MTVNQNSCAFTGRRPKSFPWKHHETARGCILLKKALAAPILMLAVFNGVRCGGAGAMVNYAQKLGREIIVLDPINRSVTHEGGGA